MWLPFHWDAWFGGLGNDGNKISGQGGGALFNAPMLQAGPRQKRFRVPPIPSFPI